MHQHTSTISLLLLSMCASYYCFHLIKTGHIQKDNSATKLSKYLDLRLQVTEADILSQIHHLCPWKGIKQKSAKGYLSLIPCPLHSCSQVLALHNQPCVLCYTWGWSILKKNFTKVTEQNCSIQLVVFLSESMKEVAFNASSTPPPKKWEILSLGHILVNQPPL